VHELCYRYLFERAVCRKHGSLAGRFLEMELLKELYFIVRDREADRERPTLVATYSGVVQNALAIIDRRLGDELSIAELAAEVGASESTLLRAFKREVGLGPQQYRRYRRLGEALLLLKSGSHAVGEVAARVGYTSLAAFSHAFHARFGYEPSSVRRRRQP
jgi:AraC-like DNA-binding protein